MPMPNGHRRGLYATPEWQSLRARNIQWVKAAGGEYLTATDWVPDTGFSDPVHMNQEGARVFSRKIAQHLLTLSL